MRIPAIVGPTASGKTALSISVAEEMGAEILSMDSRQIYRGLDIGTDKVEPGLRARVPHHGLDLVPPGEAYSAARYAREARGWIHEIRARDRVPLLVGGTGFFLRALTDPVFREPPMDPARRDRLRRWLGLLPLDELARWADVLDPKRSGIARAGGRQRLSRTLEIALLTGRPLSWWHRHAPSEEAPLQTAVILLVLPREVLYTRIDVRAEAMFERGLLEEVDGLLASGVAPDAPGMTATGYREAVQVLRGTLSKEEAVDRVRRATRAYARRQLTWFRNQLPDPVLEVDATSPPEVQLTRVLTWWEGIEGHGSG